MGVEQWVSTHEVSGRSPAFAKAIALDAANNVYIMGSGAKGFSPTLSYTTVKYDSAGAEQWATSYEGPGFSDEIASALAVNASGDVYVTGYSDGIDSRWRTYTTVKYVQIAPNNSPTIISEPDTLAYQDSLYTYQVISNDIDGDTLRYTLLVAPHWLAIDPKTGLIEGTPRYTDLGDTTVIVQVADSRGGLTEQTYKLRVVKDDKTGGLIGYRLEQNYPNPFNPSTKIRYTMAKPSSVILKVFNLTGQEVATLVNETKPAGEYQIEWNANNLPSGVYLYRLEAGEFVDTKKLLLLK
jgi:hypothetical protein